MIPENINEILLTLTAGLAALAVGLRILCRVNRVGWLDRLMRWALEYVDVGLSALLIALAVRTCIVEPFKIPSSSMERTLLIGDHLFVNRFLYGQRTPAWFRERFESWQTRRPLALRAPRRGDVIVFIPPHEPKKDFIKRVIGLPGETVEIRRKVVYIDGEPLDEPYVIHKDPAVRELPGRERDHMAPRTVPDDHYFVMGDNRDYSDDSRFWGYVPLADIKGKAMFIYFSWDRDAPALNPAEKIRWKRLAMGIH